MALLSKILKNTMRKILFILSSFFVYTTGALAGNSDSTQWKSPYYLQKTTMFSKEPISEKCIIFLGNSITEGGNWNVLFLNTKIFNRGIGGDITERVLNRLDEVVKHTPYKLFLKIRINDLLRNIPMEVVLKNYKEIVKYLSEKSPETKVYIQSILPVTKGSIPENKIGEVNKKINEVNSELTKIAKASGYTFVNLHKEFLDKDLRLRKDLSPDGLHLNEKGYEIWRDYLKTQNYL